MKQLDIVILGLSLSSSWGNGHATTYRGLIRELHLKGHRVLFLEKDMPWYSAHRDLTSSSTCLLQFYKDFPDLERRFSSAITHADLVIVGSYVPEGSKIGEWVIQSASGVKAFYDIDTPVTLKQLESGKIDYLSRELIPHYDLYLSFTGGPTLKLLEQFYGAPRARPLYCGVDPEEYRPCKEAIRWGLGYLGTYSPDRQPALEELLLKPATRIEGSRMVVAGAQYPASTMWPDNVDRIQHIPPSEHSKFYSQQKFTLNLTRADMIVAGYSPSIRLFEAAACGLPILTDYWEGLETFFRPGEDILVVRSSSDVEQILSSFTKADCHEIGLNARNTILRQHTARHRATELESYYRECQKDCKIHCLQGVS